MIDTAHFAGFCAAHTVLGIAKGRPLSPFVVILAYASQPEIRRMEAETLEDGVIEGLKILDAPHAKTERAVLVYDSIVTTEDGEKDTILLDVRQYGKHACAVTIAIPYQPKTETKEFSVGKPEFVGFAGIQEDVLPTLFDPFFEGVETHPDGAAVWNAHMDQPQEGESEPEPS